MSRRIGGAKVILGIDQAPAEEVFPIAVYERLGKQPAGVFTHPINQAMARVVNRRNF